MTLLEHLLTCDGNNILASVDSLTTRNRVVTLWSVMETRFRPFASSLVENLEILRLMKRAMGISADAGRPADQIELDAMKSAGGAIQEIVQALNLPVSCDRCRSLMLSISLVPALSTSPVELQREISSVIETVQSEIRSIQFLPIQPSAQKYLAGNFGPAVAKAFPECLDDIAEAHLCFAFARYTASMFHLGRAMESVTKKLGKKIRVPAPARDEWQPWLTAINARISAMPYKAKRERQKREILAEAAAYLFNFKEAWRNKTMHPERTYTEDQAAVIMEGAKAFLNSVATRIFKVTA